MNITKPSRTTTKKGLSATGALALACSLALPASAATYISVAGGDIETSAGWTLDSGTANPSGLPDQAGDIGNINNSVTANSGNSQIPVFGSADIFINSGGTLTTTGNGSNFNSGNSWNVAGGTLTGTSANFNGRIFNFMAGTVSISSFTSYSNNPDINVSGSVTISTGSINLGTGNAGVASSEIDFASDWTGSWTNADFDNTTGSGSWEGILVGDSDKTFDGTSIDQTIFDNNFVVTNNGQTLAVVPEPSSTALLGLGGLALILRRRK